MIFVELTSSIRFAVVTSSLNGERVELSLANEGLIPKNNKIIFYVT